MNKLIVAVLAIAVIGGGYLYFKDSNESTYVAAINDEVAELETELAELEAALASGELSDEEVIEVQGRIIARMDAINAAASDSTTAAKLTPAQRAELAAGLNRLAGMMISYKDSLVELDAQAAIITTQKPQLNPQGRRSSVGKFASIIETIEEQSAELDIEVDTEAANEAVEESIDEIEEVIAETEAEAEAEGEDGADMDDSSDPEAESSDSETDAADSDTTVEADAEIETEVETTN